MPTFRLLHQEAGKSQKVSSLSHLEYRVWTQYQLSADDFGVCPGDVVRFQADNDALRQEAPRRLAAAIARLVGVGLVRQFSHQGQRYLYQHDWQDWQRVKYPSQTTRPPIPAELLAQCSSKTAALFSQFHPKLSEAFSSRAYAGNAHANANADADASEGEPEREPPRTVPLTARSHHRGHAFCGRVCVPAFLHDELRRKLPGDADANDRPLRDWYLAIDREWWEKPIGDDDLAFWRARFVEWQGSTKAVAPTESMAEHLKRQEAKLAARYGVAQ